MFQPSVAFVSLLLFGVAASSSLFFEPKSTSVVCPDGESCPDDNTCCIDSSGQRYGCCPMKDATCCTDGQHCCPHLYKCDLAHQTCVQQSSGDAIPFDLIKYANADSSDDDDDDMDEEEVEKHDDSMDVITGNVKTFCPDSSQCPEDDTCCLLGSGKYGCCPYKKAVCCPDKAHCCPNGYECNMEKQTCSRGSLSIPWSSQPAGDDGSDVSGAADVSEPNTICKDGFRCDGEQTCCELPHGGYACCMYDRGICCADKLHCCPPDAKCNEQAQRCDHATFNLPWDNLHAHRRTLISDNAESRVEVADVVGLVCPDETKCADGSTCCDIGSSHFGCCNFPNAACCSDKVHCCPNGFTCDVPHSRCVRGTIMVPWSVSRVRDVECPDGSECVGEEETCCELPDGSYGCCPYQDAVCCSDKLHCCPSGTTCDLSHGRCANGSVSLPWSVPVSKKPPLPDTSSITCPDQTTCPNGYTCCLISDTGYGCCPHPNAVCCSDKAHCCPNGFRCNLEEMRCDKGALSLPWSATTLRTQTVMDDPCHGGEEVCPSDSTCCENRAGKASCCPLQHAVCCTDKEHCCPEGHRCNLAKKTCERDGAESLAWATSPPPPTAPVGNVVCPGGTQSCPDGSTCCLTPSGTYACCPLPEAVCCEDKIHCCPNGYKCNVAAGTCTRGDVALPWSGKQAAQSTMAPEAPEKNDVECPAGHTSCRSENAVDATCCPFENAVCCGDDGQHCCPAESTCDAASRMCKSTTSSMAISWQPTKRRSAVFHQLMDRPDALGDLDPL